MEIKKTLTMPKGDFPMRGNLPQREPEYIKKCQEQGLYLKMLQHADQDREFYLHDGPPYANGDLHAGHGLNMVLKDIIVRSKTMEGYKCQFIPGWDTHGLPIENEITKSGVDRKSMSVSEFRRLCRNYALKQVEHQKKQALRMGLVGDFANPYITLHNDYEADEIHVFAEMFQKGLIYRGLKPVHWSPVSETACAQADIEYKNLPAKTLFVRFRVKKPVQDLREGDAFVIWTTTPWTIPSNLAVCLNPDMEYGVYETDQGRLIFLVSLEEKLVKELNLTRVKLKNVYKGSQLEGAVCRHPFYDRDSIVITGKHVTAEDGTGCVHTAPGLGEDDYKVGLKYGLKPYCPVDSKGCLTAQCGPRLAGKFYADADDIVIEMLTETGALLKEEDIEHSYPVDARNGKPLIFRTAPQWFCSVDKIRDRLVSECEKVEFVPAWGKIRLKNMLEGRSDWCISRQRAWGVPIPVIYCQDGTPVGEPEVFANIEKEVREKGSSVWYDQPAEYFLPAGYSNPHSPDGRFSKETDIMDVWFDSGSSWLNAEKNRGLPYPADLVLEGNDQYRGWYNASMIISVALNGISPYKQIVTNGFIVDQNGQKFSKSKKNGIYPEAICNDYGADVFRLWVASIDYTTAEISLTQDLLKSVSDEYRKIRNTFKFMLANLHDDETRSYDPENDKYELSLADKMILNQLKILEAAVRKDYASYDFLSASSELLNFLVNDLSGWYLDVSKDVLYCDKKDSLRRKGVQHTLYVLTKTLALLYTPILTFTADEAYQDLPGKKEEFSNLERFPELGEIDPELTGLYKRFNNLRALANRSLEAARKEGIIKGANEGILNLNGKDKEQLDLLKTFSAPELARLLGFSRIVLDSESEGEELLKIQKAAGPRCDRCWAYVPDVTQKKEGFMCTRCHEAYLCAAKEAGEETDD